MQLRYAAVVLILVIAPLGLPLALHAQQPTAQFGRAIGPRSPVPPARSSRNPYSRLFGAGREVPHRKVEQATPPASKSQAAPRVVCGMTVVPADPGVDSRFLVARPPTPTRFTLRVIEPSLCR
jgi:hypothetical protein